MGCQPPSAFSCESNEDCVDGARHGICQAATGYCSFVDSTCASGQRYGGLAGGSLADTCVDVDASTGSTSTSTATSTSTPGDASTSDPTTTAGPSTLSTTSTTAGTGTSTEGGQTSEMDSAVTTNDEDTTSSTGDATTVSSDTEMTSVSCAPFLDDFADATIGPAWTNQDPPLISESAGALEFDITAAEDGWVGIDYEGDIDFSENSVRIELGVGPSASAAQLGVYISAEGVSDHYLLLYQGQFLFARHMQADPTTVRQEPFDPDAHRWVQLRGEAGRVYVETSPDGLTFTEFYSEQAAFDLSNVRVWIGASNWQAIAQDETVSIETFEACGGP